MDKKNLETALNTFKTEFVRLHEIVEALPKTSGDLEKLLIELKEADIDKMSHFKRFPRNYKDGHYQSDNGSPEMVEADWTRVLRRFESAVQSLVNFARVAVPEENHEKSSSEENQTEGAGSLHPSTHPQEEAIRLG